MRIERILSMEKVHMRRSGKAACLFFIILLLSLAFTACSKTRNDQIVCLNVDQSWFCDFSISDNAVRISCVVYLENRSNDIVEIKLCGYFPEDNAANLLAQEKLYASLPGERSDAIIPVEPGGKAYSVEFVGDFAGHPIKHDRNLPTMEVEIIQ